MLDIHRILLVMGMFFIIPLLSILLIVAGILSILGGDNRGFIGIVMALFFLFGNIWAVKQYTKNKEEFLERDIRARVRRDALVPMIFSLFFLFLSMLNLIERDMEGGLIFLAISITLMVAGIIFYYQKRRINV